jgi:hypothetical protein
MINVAKELLGDELEEVPDWIDEVYSLCKSSRALSGPSPLQDRFSYDRSNLESTMFQFNQALASLQMISPDRSLFSFDYCATAMQINMVWEGDEPKNFYVDNWEEVKYLNCLSPPTDKYYEAGKYRTVHELVMNGNPGGKIIPYSSCHVLTLSLSSHVNNVLVVVEQVLTCLNDISPGLGDRFANYGDFPGGIRALLNPIEQCWNNVVSHPEMIKDKYHLIGKMLMIARHYVYTLEDGSFLNLGNQLYSAKKIDCSKVVIKSHIDVDGKLEPIDEEYPESGYNLHGRQIYIYDPQQVGGFGKLADLPKIEYGFQSEFQN